MKLKSFFIASTLTIITATAVAMQVTLPRQTDVPSEPLTHTIPNMKPKVEAVFVLDTTGSMGGLIAAAKNNIWSIASSMASAEPAPDMRMGLVAFRDRGDAYITKVMDLSQDLDAMYLSLSNFQAQGGGDGPESVNAALHAAVHDINWSQDNSTYKVIFLVGDAPPHMDYHDEARYPEIIKQAQAKGIVVNCIQAGSQAETRQIWQQIASLNQGAYFQVEQGGDAVAVSTPFDAKLAELARQLDTTKLFYGKREQREKLETKDKAARDLFASAPASVQAKRADYNSKAAGASNLFADGELVDDVVSGKVELDAIAVEELPQPLTKLSRAEQKKLIAETAEKRRQIQEEIAQLGEQRQQYIADQLDEAEVTESLDGKIHEAIKLQAGEKGLRYQARPTL